MDDRLRHELRKKLFKLRVQISKTRKALQTAREIKDGRSLGRKTSKLLLITCIKTDSGTTRDPSEWAQLGSHEYLRRWIQDAPTDSGSFDLLGGDLSGVVEVSAEEMKSALERCGKAWRLDRHGLCIRALDGPARLLVPLADLASKYLSSDELWGDILVSGVVKAKEKGNIPISCTRALIPQNCFLQPLNHVMILKFQARLDNWSKEAGLSGLVLGVSKGFQARDMVFPLDQVLEKGRDRHNECGVALGDIRRCHDELLWGAQCEVFYGVASRAQNVLRSFVFIGCLRWFLASGASKQ